MLVKIAGAVCLVFLAVLLFFNHNRTPVEPEVKVAKPRISAGEAFDKVLASSPQKIELVLKEASLNRETNRIEGMVTNNSDRQYSDVEIVFFVSLADLTQGTTTVVGVPRLGPREEAKFVSDPVDPRTRQWAVKSITGTPQ